MDDLDAFQARLLSGGPLEPGDRSFLSGLVYSVHTAALMAGEVEFSVSPAATLAGLLTSVLGPFTARFPVAPADQLTAWLELWEGGGRLTVREGSREEPGTLVAELHACPSQSTALTMMWAAGWTWLGQWHAHADGVWSVSCRRSMPDTPPARLSGHLVTPAAPPEAPPALRVASAAAVWAQDFSEVGDPITERGDYDDLAAVPCAYPGDQEHDHEMCRDVAADTVRTGQSG